MLTILLCQTVVVGRDRERDAEIIEVFMSGGQPEGSPTPRPAPGRRPRAAIAGVLAAMALVGAAVLWPDTAGSPRPTGRTTDPVATGEPPARDNTAPDNRAVEAPPRFVVDPPSGWSVYSADLLSPADDSTWFGLWAGPGSSATSGRWMSVTVAPARRPPEAIVDATRSVIGGFESSSPIADPGLRRVVVPLAESWATLVARGLDDATLVSIAAGMTPAPARGEPPGVRAPTDLVFVAGGADLASLIGGDPLSEVLYSADATGTTPIDVTLTVGSGSEADLVRAVVPYFLRDPIISGGSWVGERFDRPGQHVLGWTLGAFAFTLEGPVEVNILRSFASTIRRASSAEWEQLLYSRRPGVRLGELVQVAAGTTTDGHGWTAGVRIAERDGITLFGWAAAPLDTPEGPPYGARPVQAFPDATQVTSLVIPGATYVFASTPSIGGRPMLRISVGDRTVEVPFVAAGPRSPMLVAAYAFSEPVGFQAEVTEAS